MPAIQHALNPAAVPHQGKNPDEELWVNHGATARRGVHEEALAASSVCPHAYKLALFTVRVLRTSGKARRHASEVAEKRFVHNIRSYNRFPCWKLKEASYETCLTQLPP